MKHILFDHHSNYCRRQTKDTPVNWCEKHPNEILLFAGSDFYLIEHFSCYSYGNKNKYDFIESVLREIFNSAKLEADVKRGMYNLSIYNFRKRGIAMKKYVDQVNYLYHDNTSRKFAITSSIPFLDGLCNQDVIYDNYLKAIDELKAMDIYQYHKDFLYRLMLMNCDFVSDIEVIRTTDHLIELIKNQINETANGNNKKNKQQGIIKARIQHDDAAKKQGHISRGGESPGKSTEAIKQPS